MKRFARVWCTVSLVLAILATPLLSTVSVQALAGTGTSGDPFLISTCAELQDIELDVTANYKLTNDINCGDTVTWNSGDGFVPIGDTQTFSGTLDGDNHSIADLYILSAANRVGLFSRVNGGTVSNLSLTNAFVSGDSQVGGIAGFASGNAVFTNVAVNADAADGDCSTAPCITATGGLSLGGIVGYADSITIDGAKSGGPVQGETNNTGGLIGQADATTITNASSSATVKGLNNVGGLVGQSGGATTMNNVMASGDVTGFSNGGGGYAIGGLAGFLTNTTVTHAWANGDVAAADGSAGGLVGIMQGVTADNTFATGNVDIAFNRAGGYAALIEYSDINHSYASGSVNGANQFAGGFAAELESSTVQNSFATGAVTSGSAPGGFYSIHTSTTFTNVYFDITRTGIVDCAGAGLSTPGCTGVNAGSSDPDYFFFNNTNAPLDTWDFGAGNPWHKNLDNYPSLTPVEGTQNMICYQPASTDTTIHGHCTYQPYGFGTPTWEARYKLASASTWTTVTLADIYSADVTVTGLDPGTEYQLSFRPTSLDDPTFNNWGTLSITTTGTAPIVSNDPVSTGNSTSTKTVTLSTSKIVSATTTNAAVQAGPPTVIDSSSAIAEVSEAITSSDTEQTTRSDNANNAFTAPLDDTVSAELAKKSSASTFVVYGLGFLLALIVLALTTRRKKRRHSKTK